jgi:type I restriction enzyme S subunit
MAEAQIPHGYKQTEVGVIPEDWDTRSCSALSDLITVGIVIRPTQYYTKQGVPALRSANIREDKIDAADMVFISEKANALLSKSQVRTGDVLTVRTGYPGTSAIVPPNFAGANCIDILITRPSKAVNSKYLAAWINSPFGKHQVLRNQGGLAQQHFNVGDLRNLVVALPPLAEQEAIAGTLSDADALIESLEQLIAKKRQIEQGATQELLTGKKRLPGFTTEPGYQQTEVGVIPEDWEVRPLASLGRRGRPVIKAGPFGSSLTKDKYVAEGYKVYGQEQVIRGDYLYGDYFISKALFNDLKSCAVEPGDILLSLVGTAGRVLIIPDGAPEGIINPRLIRFSFDRVIVSPYFFQYLFETETYQALLARSAQGGTMGVLNAGLLRPICIPVPLLAEQEAIAAILSDMNAEIAALEARLAKARQVKQGMLQELLTGKTRLVESAK